MQKHITRFLHLALLYSCWELTKISIYVTVSSSTYASTIYLLLIDVITSDNKKAILLYASLHSLVPRLSLRMTMTKSKEGESLVPFRT